MPSIGSGLQDIGRGVGNYRARKRQEEEERRRQEEAKRREEEDRQRALAAFEAMQAGMTSTEAQLGASAGLSGTDLTRRAATRKRAESDRLAQETRQSNIQEGAATEDVIDRPASELAILESRSGGKSPLERETSVGVLKSGTAGQRADLVGGATTRLSERDAELRKRAEEVFSKTFGGGGAGGAPERPVGLTQAQKLELRERVAGETVEEKYTNDLNASGVRTVPKYKTDEEIDAEANRRIQVREAFLRGEVDDTALDSELESINKQIEDAEATIDELEELIRSKNQGR